MPLERQKIQVLIVGDNAGMRDGIRALIDSQPDMTVSGEATNCEEAIQKFKMLLPDIVIGDVEHPFIWNRTGDFEFIHVQMREHKTN